MNRSKKTFGKKADEFLKGFYKFYGLKTIKDKIYALNKNLGGTVNFYSDHGDPTEKQKLACLEYEYLEKHGKIRLTYC